MGDDAAEKPIEVLGLRNCDACRRLMRELAAAGRPARLRDLRAEPLTAAEIAAILADLGAGAINRRSASWRALDPAERAADPADLLAAHPTLLRRPVVRLGGRWCDGRDRAVRRALGLG